MDLFDDTMLLLFSASTQMRKNTAREKKTQHATTKTNQHSTHNKTKTRQAQHAQKRKNNSTARTRTRRNVKHCIHTGTWTLHAKHWDNETTSLFQSTPLYIARSVCVRLNAWQHDTTPTPTRCDKIRHRKDEHIGQHQQLQATP